jgi:hypothetical protein
MFAISQEVTAGGKVKIGGNSRRSRELGGVPLGWRVWTGIAGRVSTGTGGGCDRNRRQVCQGNSNFYTEQRNIQ